MVARIITATRRFEHFFHPNMSPSQFVPAEHHRAYMRHKTHKNKNRLSVEGRPPVTGYTDTLSCSRDLDLDLMTFIYEYHFWKFSSDGQTDKQTSPKLSVASLGGGPPRVTPSRGWRPIESVIFAAEFGRTQDKVFNKPSAVSWRAERVWVVTVYEDH